MTPATKALKKAGVSFKLHEYQHNAQSASYGEEASNLLGVDPQQVFKTLLVAINVKKLAVAIIPVSHQLNLKATAKALAVKKITMANPHDAEKATGYVLGGISPFGLKKRLPFMVDKSALNFTSIYVSGGRRGLEIEVCPSILVKLCDAKLCNIKSS